MNKGIFLFLGIFLISTLLVGGYLYSQGGMETLENILYLPSVLSAFSENPNNTNQIGYEYLEDNILHLWNNKDDYYINMTSGIQVSNHKDQFWTHNTFCLGYKTTSWNYKCTDSLPITMTPSSDNSTYVQVTGNRLMSIGAKTVNVSLTYDLYPDEREIQITPKLTNVGSAISNELGFAWRTNDIKINNDTQGDLLLVNNTWYNLSTSLDLLFTEDTLYEPFTNFTFDWNTSCLSTEEDEALCLENITEFSDKKPLAFYKLQDRSFVQLRWNENLNYFLQVKSVTGQDNAPVTLAITTTGLNVGQTKNTTFYWRDPAPRVTLLTPEDNEGNLGSEVNFTALVDDYPATNISFWTNTSGSWALEETHYTQMATPTESIDRPVPTDGMVIYYRFNNGSGENNSYVKDWSGNGLDLYTVGGDAKSYNDFINGTWDFDGNNDYIERPDNAAFSGLSAMTVCFWWYFDSDDYGYHQLIGQADWSGNRAWRFRFEQGANLIWHISNDGNDPGTAENKVVVADHDIIENNWYHVCGTYDDADSDELNLYVDGALLDTDTGESGGIYDSSADLTIGAPSDNGDGGSSGDPDMRIDEVLIYNRSLNLTEIQQIYNLTTYREENFTLSGLSTGEYDWNVYAEGAGSTEGSRLHPQTFSVSQAGTEPCSAGWCEFDYTYVSADLKFCESGSLLACGMGDLGYQMKWDVSSLCGDSDAINSAYLEMYILSKGGTPDNDYRFRFISDQDWHEGTTLTDIQSQSGLNLTTYTDMSSTTAATRTNFTVTKAIEQACANGDDYASFRITDADYDIVSIAHIDPDTTYLQMGNNNFMTGQNYYSLAASDHATVSYRPNLYVDYNSSASDDVTPNWTSNSTSGTEAGSSVTHNVTLSDETELGSFIFSFDNGTGTFTNDSSVGISGTEYNVSVSKIVNATEGSTIQWKVYFYDDFNNANVTDTFSYTTTSSPVPTWNNTKSNNVINNKIQASNHTFYWYDNQGKTISGCTLDFGGTNYSGTPSGSECSATVSSFSAGSGTNYTLTGFMEYSGTNYSTTQNWTQVWNTVASISGQWIMRAPVNSSSEANGDSHIRRYGEYYGNGQDQGVLWRKTTEDDDGFTAFEKDEERHCGSWGQFYIDEPNITEGYAENYYCHVWLYADDQGDTNYLRGGWAGNSTDAMFDPTSYISGPTYYPSFYAEPGLTNHFELIIDYNASWNYNLSSQADILNLSYKPGGANVQVLSYENYKSWCIINLEDNATLQTMDSDGDGLNDFEELFENFTDPYDNDTDKDGFSDGYEIDNEKNAWDTYDWGELTIYYANDSNFYGTWESDNHVASEPSAQSTTAVLSNTFTTDEETNITDYDLNYTLRSLETTLNNYWGEHQTNLRMNIDENEDSIQYLTVFTGGKFQTEGSYVDEYVEWVVDSASLQANEYHIPGKKGTTPALFVKQFRNTTEIKDIITANKVYTRFYRKGQVSTQDTFQNNYFDWFEVWVVTGASYIDMISPTVDSPLTAQNQSNLSIAFNFTEQGTKIISGVEVQNITIDGEICTLSGEAYYENNQWNQYCTAPNKTDASYDLVLIANTSTSGFLTATVEEGITYVANTCTYSGSGDWFVECSDQCLLNTLTNVGGNIIIFNGTGYAVITQEIYNYKNIRKESPGTCYVAKINTERVYS